MSSSSHRPISPIHVHSDEEEEENLDDIFELQPILPPLDIAAENSAHHDAVQRYIDREVQDFKAEEMLQASRDLLALANRAQYVRSEYDVDALFAACNRILEDLAYKHPLHRLPMHTRVTLDILGWPDTPRPPSLLCSFEWFFFLRALSRALEKDV